MRTARWGRPTGAGSLRREPSEIAELRVLAGVPRALLSRSSSALPRPSPQEVAPKRRNVESVTVEPREDCSAGALTWLCMVAARAFASLVGLVGITFGVPASISSASWPARNCPARMEPHPNETHTAVRTRSPSARELQQRLAQCLPSSTTTLPRARHWRHIRSPPLARPVLIGMLH